MVVDAAAYLTDEWKENDWLSLHQPAVDRRPYEKFKTAICHNPEMEIKFNYLMTPMAPAFNQHHHLAKKGVERHCNYNSLEVLNLNFNRLNLN